MKLHDIYHGLLFMGGHRAVARLPAPEAPDAAKAAAGPRDEQPYATWSRHAASPAPPCAGEPTTCGWTSIRQG